MDNLLSGFRFTRKKSSYDDDDEEMEIKSETESAAQQQVSEEQALKDGNTDISDEAYNTDDEQTSSETTTAENTSMRIGKGAKNTDTDQDFDLPDSAIINPYSSRPPMPEVDEDGEDESEPKAEAVSESEPEFTSAVIGPKIFIRGEISGDENLIIQGKVEGSIDLSGQHLIIGIDGAVIANIKAKTVTVEGNVAGDVIGEERIEIKASSQVKGNLISERVTLEDGARFRGSIDMDGASEQAPTPVKADTNVSKKDDLKEESEEAVV